jgi:hypothetical protein
MKHYLGICLVLLTLAAIVLFALHRCTTMVGDTIANVRDAFAQVLKVQPQITVNQRVVMTQTAPIAELAVVTKEELVTLGFTEHFQVLSYQVPLTEKTLSVEAVYRLKAGFDLREPFRVEIDPVTHHIHATMPHAKILSVEQVGDLTYHGEDSALNRITDDERQKILNDLNSLARTQAETSSLKADAEKEIGSRLQEILQHNGESVRMDWTAAGSLPPSS